MIFQVYTTRNKKSGAYGKLDMQLMDEKQAIENYSVAYLESTKDSKILFQELELYHLGSYDTIKGELVGLEKPVFLLDLGAIGDGKEK